MGETKLPPKACDAKANTETQATTALEPQYEVWKPDRLNRALSELNQDVRKTVLLFRTVNSVLNKVTPENYSKLEDKMKNLPIDSLPRMQGVVDIIHKKAIDEWKFRSLYARLCNVMRNVQIINEEGSTQRFEQFLTAKCIQYFDNSFIDELEFRRRKREIDSCIDLLTKKFLARKYETEEYNFRKQSVGNCQFIGELFQLDMLYRNRIFQMMDKLFESGGNMALECSCALVTIIGQFYENRFEKFPEKYFDQITSLLPNEELSSRIRFLLQNILDLRNNSWCPKMLPELPQTLQQIEQDLLDEGENRSTKARVKNSNKSKKNKKRSNKSSLR